MQTLDPDILAVLKTIAATPELVRQVKVAQKHEKQLEERINTKFELLTDELEQVIPRDHPMFNQVLIATVIRKLARMVTEKRNRNTSLF